MRTTEICLAILVIAGASAGASAQMQMRETVPGGGTMAPMPAQPAPGAPVEPGLARPGPGLKNTTTGTATTAVPLTTNECQGLGGDVADSSVCTTGKTCHTFDSNKVDHWQCITKLD